jgi:hypothetical protein
MISNIGPHLDRLIPTMMILRQLFIHTPFKPPSREPTLEKPSMAQPIPTVQLTHQNRGSPHSLGYIQKYQRHDMPAKKKAVPADRDRVDLVAGLRPVAFAQSRIDIIGVTDGHFRRATSILFTIFAKDVDHLKRTARGRDDAGIDDGPPRTRKCIFQFND